LLQDETLINVTQPLRVSVSKVGRPLDFTFAAGEMPVVTTRVAELLSTIAGNDVQLIPITVAGMHDRYVIVNVTARVDCIDTRRSDIMWFEPGNDIRPDLAGTPQMITKLIIDSDRVYGHHMLRPEGWDLAVIVSHTVKQLFERAHVSGVLYTDVCEHSIH
jgi:hypothetical protein